MAEDSTSSFQPVGQVLGQLVTLYAEVSTMCVYLIKPYFAQ